jgi:copper chaperone CopZ
MTPITCRRISRLGLALLAVSVTLVAGCSGSGPDAADADMNRSSSAYATAPMSADRAVLRVNGMSCPKCANNIDKQLAELPGVRRSSIDMGAGEVTVMFGKGPRPSEAELASAIEESGFTLVGISEASGPQLP